MKCVKPKPTDLLIVDIFVHVIILLGILLGFFVLFISKLETSELENQIKTQIDQNIPKLYDNINNTLDKSISIPEKYLSWNCLF